MRIEQLYRYPLKGLSAEALGHADLPAGGVVPWDRSFALAHGEAGFDPACPRWLPKQNFMCLMKNARIAAIASRFDDATGRLALRHRTEVFDADALSEDGRAAIGRWLGAILGDEARGVPRFHYVPGHVFADQRRPLVSLINLASLAALEREAGAAREAARFRANIYFSGADAWEEFGWIGRVLRVGGATLRVTKRTERCPATQVNPATARRDADPPAELRAAFGHADLGVFAEVAEAGRITVGDEWEASPGSR